MNPTNSVALDEALKSLNDIQIGGPQTTLTQPWTPGMVITLSLSLLGFGLIICGLMAWLIFKDKRAVDLLRVFSLPLIIVSAVLLVVAGYTDRQITSVIGLLGTIAGYLLGSQQSSREKGERSSEPQDKKPGESTEKKPAS